MLITVPIVSTDLKTILGVNYGKVQSMRSGENFTITIQNLGATDIFLEMIQASAVVSGLKILATTGEFTFNTSDLSKINLISSVANANVRIFTS